MKGKNVNAKYYFQCMLSMLINMVLFSVVFIIFALVQKDKFLYYCTLVIVGILLPFVIYYLVQFIYYQKVLLTDIQEAKLTNVIHNTKRLTSYKINMKIGKKVIAVRTKPCFSNNTTSPTFFENYLNQKCLVGYNKAKDEAVVISVLDEKEVE